ncbi:MULTISPECIES: PepSY domain-containing protein [Paracoccus]|uniref:PepSY domain-containing protein n=1 Tax=Paracoccus litorisediminis TaxID=2006130 RepID=A0A844HQM8_9RHOB|nr:MULTISPECIES: hypothetical protein [Paracoccus]MBD9527854.1 hypothetical protein [Paracoccus sp. PAR01]MTH59981.1 hypothetical protein [Paracoccus litorisediminis]
MLEPGLKSLLSRWLAVPGLAGLLVLGLHVHPSAAPRDDHPAFEHDQLEDEFELMEHPDFRVIPLQQAAELATDRFRGRLIAARLRPPTPDERARGVELVHELRLLTQRRDVLLIRLDARTGAFLEVRGSGLTEARRRHEDRK